MVVKIRKLYKAKQQNHPKSTMEEDTLLQRAQHVPRRILAVENNPFFYTALWGTMGVGVAVKTAIEMGANAGRGPAAVGLTCLAAGALGDGMRQLLLYRRKRSWRNHDLDLAKVVGGEALEKIIEQVRDAHGYTGKCQRIEMRGRAEGTGITQGGYFTLLTLRFEDGNEAKLFYKYSEKPTNAIGSGIVGYLRQKGHAFIPRVYTGNMPDSRFALTALVEDAPLIMHGQFYEYLEGDSLENILQLGESSRVVIKPRLAETVDRLFEKMWRVYQTEGSNGPAGLGEMATQGKLVHTILGYPSAGETITALRQLTERLEDRALSDQERPPLHAPILFAALLTDACSRSAQKGGTLVHGDLHPGNVLDVTEGGSEKVIDWDNAGRELPYYDFFHFAVLSDFERYPEYRIERDLFLAQQKELFPSTSAEDAALIEFRVYISLLHRYYQTAEDGRIREEFEPNMLKTCKYLLERSRSAVTEYARTAGDNPLCPVLVSAYEKYTKQRFPLLESVDHDDQASVAYAHHVNHRYRRVAPEEQAHANLQRDLDRVESLVAAEDRGRSLLLGNATALSFLGGIGLAAAAATGTMDQAPDTVVYGIPTLLTITTAIYAGMGRLMSPFVTKR